MVSPRRVLVLPAKLLGLRDRAGENSPDGTAGSAIPEGDPTGLLCSLSQIIATGDYHLDPILADITEAAHSLTDASGAAIAVGKGESVVCRARCGEGAPPLGASLSPDSGISGHCLRSGLPQNCVEAETDTRVDPELCRALGLRSIAVVPIPGWQGANGILEVVSNQPHAFTAQHIVLLQDLATLAERARAAILPPTAAIVGAAELPLAPLIPPRSRPGDLILNSKRNQLVVCTVAVLALFLLGLAIRLTFRSPQEARTAPPASLPVVTANPGPGQALDNIPPAKPDAGRKSAAPWQNSVRSTVKLASQLATTHSRTVARTQPKTASSLNTGPSTVVSGDLNHASGPVETAAFEAPPILSAAPGNSTIQSVLPSVAAVPSLAVLPVSQVSGGSLIHRVDPVYPVAARQMRLQGEVVMQAIIAEDGTVQDLTVVTGHPVLADAALDAVRQWRYKPYELDHKPVRVETRITVNFRAP